MNKMPLNPPQDYDLLITQIGQVYTAAQRAAHQAISAEKDDVMVEYAMYKNNAQLYVAKYQLYLPDKAILEQRIKKILEKE